MTTDFRAMCAELIEAMTDDSTSCWQREADVIDRARALLAQQPVSLTCELPEPEGPPAVTISDLLHPGYKLCAELIELCTPVDSIPQLAERLQKLNALADRARALLAQPVAKSPADGEVAELVEWLQSMRDLAGEHNPDEQRRYTRAAELLERPTPQPVAVSERLPEPEDCIKRGNDHWCWGQERSLLTGQASARWRLMRVSALTDEAVNWLPANALPTPEATND